MLKFTGPERVCSNVMSGAIGNLVITNNYRGEYMSCEGYIIEITKSGLIPCWIIVQELNNINDLIENKTRTSLEELHNYVQDMWHI